MITCIVICRIFMANNSTYMDAKHKVLQKYNQVKGIIADWLNHLNTIQTKNPAFLNIKSHPASSLPTSQSSPQR